MVQYNLKHTPLNRSGNNNNSSQPIVFSTIIEIIQKKFTSDDTTFTIVPPNEASIIPDETGGSQTHPCIEVKMDVKTGYVTIDDNPLDYTYSQCTKIYLKNNTKKFIYPFHAFIIMTCESPYKNFVNTSADALQPETEDEDGYLIATTDLLARGLAPLVQKEQYDMTDKYKFFINNFTDIIKDISTFNTQEQHNNSNPNTIITNVEIDDKIKVFNKKYTNNECSEFDLSYNYNLKNPKILIDYIGENI